MFKIKCLEQSHEILVSLFSSVQLFSYIWLFETLWTVACQASLSITNSWSLLKLMSIESLMPSNHLILYHPLLLLPSVFPSIRVFSNESALHIRWPKYWNFSFSISSSKEYSGLTSFSDSSTLLQEHIGHLPTWGVHLSVSYLFAFSYCSWGSQGRNTEVACQSLLQWTTFCQTSPPWPICRGWPHTAWLSLTELDTTVVLWSDWLISVITVSVCLPFDALSQHLPSYI